MTLFQKPLPQILVASAALIAGLWLAPSAHATPFVYEPDDFAIGTALTHAVLGVTLTVSGRPDAVVLVRDGFSAFNGRNVATTGTRVFGNQPAFPPLPDGQVWDEGLYSLLRVDFALPTDFVQIDLIFDDDDVGILRAYDINGILLGSSVGAGDGRGSVPFVTAMIARAVADIAYITAGGVGGEALLLDNLHFNLYAPAPIPTPLPASLALLGLGLLGIGATRRRMNRTAF